MAVSISSLTSSFTYMSLPSQISQKPHNFSLSPSTISSPLSRIAKPPRLVVVASSSATLEAADVSAPSDDFDIDNIEKYVKSRLIGGFAAQTFMGTGRRKAAVARVVLMEGNGKVIINYRDAKEYLQGNPLWVQYCTAPLAVLGYEKDFDVFVKAHGGGLSGQAQAISLGVARALLKIDENYRRALRVEGLLTRDSRVVERKKVGLKKARKAPQFSKR